MPTKITILGVYLPVSDKVIYATEEASREYINAMKDMNMDINLERWRLQYQTKSHGHSP